MGIIAAIMLLGWGDVLRPSQGTAEPIGFYANGCIAGANTLSLDGIGYQVIRPSRNRFYGHPNTLQFIQNLGASMQALESGILVGDISQPRGGPMVSGHASHQIGLDVDIWFWTHPEQTIRSLSLEERETLPHVSMLGPNGLVDPTRFTTTQISKLKLAATSPEVERIFVNPAIKTYLCAILPASDAAWLHTLRPWAGHHEHFHVRLACPKNAKDCVSQEPQAPGTGCDEVIPKAFSEEITLTFPARCAAVLKSENGTEFENQMIKSEKQKTNN